MSGTWSGADELHLSAGPWRQGSDGAWRVLPADEVALTAPTDDTNDLTDVEREALAESDEWARYVAAEVDDVLNRHGLT